MDFIYKLFIKRDSFSNIFWRGSFILGVSLLRLAKHAYRQLQLRNILQYHCSCIEKAKNIHGHVGFATTIGETHYPSHGHACIHPPQVSPEELAKQAWLILTDENQVWFILTEKIKYNCKIVVKLGMIDFNGKKLDMIDFNGKKIKRKN